jgi:hypothetical protein
MVSSYLRPSIFAYAIACTSMYAQDRIVANPELDYVSSPLPEGLRANGDEVLRLELNLQSGAEPTIFLTFKNFGSRSGYVWTAYVPLGDGRYQRIDYADGGKSVIQFRPDFYCEGEVNGISNSGDLWVLYPGKGGGNLVRYNIRDRVASKQDARTLNYNDPEDRIVFEKLFKRKVDEALPADDFRRPPYKVLSAEKIKATADQQPAVEESRPDHPTPASPLPTERGPTASATLSPEPSAFLRPQEQSIRRVIVITGIVVVLGVVLLLIWRRSRN